MYYTPGTFLIPWDFLENQHPCTEAEQAVGSMWGDCLCSVCGTVYRMSKGNIRGVPPYSHVLLSCHVSSLIWLDRCKGLPLMQSHVDVGLDQCNAV
jgi:hypothetical protein